MNIFEREWVDIATIDIVDDTTRENLNQNALRQAIDKVLEVLPQRERIVIIHHFFHDENFTEIAERFGVCSARIAQILHKGLRTLRKEKCVEIFLEMGVDNVAKRSKEYHKINHQKIMEEMAREKELIQLQINKENARQECLRKAAQEAKIKQEKIHEENQIAYENLQQEIKNRNDEEEKARLHIRYMMEGNGVPKGIYLRVTGTDMSNVKFSLAVLPNPYNWNKTTELLPPADSELYQDYINKLIERAKWMQKNGY